MWEEGGTPLPVWFVNSDIFRIFFHMEFLWIKKTFPGPEVKRFHGWFTPPVDWARWAKKTGEKRVFGAVSTSSGKFSRYSTGVRRNSMSSWIPWKGKLLQYWKIQWQSPDEAQPITLGYNLHISKLNSELVYPWKVIISKRKGCSSNHDFFRPFGLSLRNAQAIFFGWRCGVTLLPSRKWRLNMNPWIRRDIPWTL